MAMLTIERRGGLAGLAARGEVDMASLSQEDRAAVEALFGRRGKFPAGPGGDRFIFRLTRAGASGTKSVEVPEQFMPSALVRAVKDVLP